jgi:hypothetical protein
MNCLRRMLAVSSSRDADETFLTETRLETLGQSRDRDETETLENSSETCTSRAKLPATIGVDVDDRRIKLVQIDT